MRKHSIWMLCLLGSLAVTAQKLPVVDAHHPLSLLKLELMEGDRSALLKLAGYFDSRKKVVEYLGYHRLETRESDIAKRIVAENTLFTADEVRLDSSITAGQFTAFLQSRKVVYSPLATSFLVTPLVDRPAHVSFRAITEQKQQQLQQSGETLLKLDWVQDNRIDSLTEARNPAALLLIASEFFQKRNQFNSYYDKQEDFVQLLQYLTGVDIGGMNKEGVISWHPDTDYDPESRLNLLIYFARYYQEYVWDEKNSVFVRPGLTIAALSRETLLFDLLNHKNDSIALDAFCQLSVSDPETVTPLATEYREADLPVNDELPLFPYAFLDQLVLFTAYCRENGLDFTGDLALQNQIKRLQSELSFAQRRVLEDSLIQTLTLQQITALEYWTLIHEKSVNLTFSAGRILDIFYSNHWQELMRDERQLVFFLKKAHWFDELGIIGSCNNYLFKFTRQHSAMEVLDALAGKNPDLGQLVEAAKKYCQLSIAPPEDDLKINDANQDYKVKNLRRQLDRINRIIDPKKRKEALTDCLSKINYPQIGEAVEILEAWGETDVFDFLEYDFGFFAYWDFENPKTRQRFLADYKRFPEFDFYRNMLEQSGLQYFHSDNTLNYEKVYDALKYNVTKGFVGGGSSAQDNEVYAVVKLLELTQHTTLGYPKKLCNSNNIYNCDAKDRANFWMYFLIKKKLVKQEKALPVSFFR